MKLTFSEVSKRKPKHTTERKAPEKIIENFRVSFEQSRNHNIVETQNEKNNEYQSHP
jgi:hypothetical protein